MVKYQKVKQMFLLHLKFLLWLESVFSKLTFFVV